MLTFGAQSLTYDANGNLTGDGSSTFTWNARDQLASVTGASFVYDGLGRRMTKTIGTASTSYLYDGVDPVQERVGGSPSANLITGLGIDEGLARADSAGMRVFLTDALGSAVALADSAKVIQTQYTYEPYGKATVTGQSSTNPFQFTRRENDSTGLFYYRARYTSPNLERFISEDAAGM